MTEVTDNQKDLTLQVFKKNTKMIYIRSLLKEYYNRQKENQSIDLTPDTLCIQEFKTKYSPNPLAKLCETYLL